MKKKQQLINFTFKYDLTLSHVLIFLTLLRRKCGNSDFLARLDDVKCENSLAYNNLCLNVRSATPRRKNNKQERINLSNERITSTVLSLLLKK